MVPFHNGSLSNDARNERKKSAAPGGRSYAEACGLVAENLRVDFLRHSNREYYYRRTKNIVKDSGFPVFWKIRQDATTPP